ncbi:hypothetical protein K7X08_020077 [Anisodus acutangulus]|uniref:Serine/threonine-protein kinase SAPK3 n=1 Tax=Anisodus acutangulus TaxID=402998 RepID=A0A9Q1REM1_9SOLA|nr:hypothetical protein K7X08_020077 [Anisodus acutangulus]
MLVGAYPYEDPEDPRNFRKTIERITIPEIKEHPWFLKNLPKELMDCENSRFEEIYDKPQQRVEEILRIIQEAKIPGEVLKPEDQAAPAGATDSYGTESDLEFEIYASDDLVAPV